MTFKMLKDPDAILDYRVDWTEWLNGDTISNSQWIVPSEMTLQSSTNDATSATAWLSGGVVGSSHDVTNRITTAAGRTDDRTITFHIQER